MLRFAAPRALLILYHPTALARGPYRRRFEGALLIGTLTLLIVQIRHSPLPERTRATTMMKVLRWLLLP